jgi:uncharacterized damage-inducible protein DinB
VSTQHFQAFVRHAYWGLDKLLEAFEQVPERLDEEPSAGARSPRVTLQHMYMFERGFLARLQGEDVSPSDRAPEDFEELRAAWVPVRHGWIELLDSLTDEQLDEPFELRLWNQRYRTTRANVISQFVQHQGQHRSELAVMASTFGHSPGEFDWWDFLEETGHPLEEV